VGVLVIFSSIIGFFVMPIAFLLDRNIFALSSLQIGLLIGTGFVYALAIIPYLYTLKKEDTSTIVPLWQLIPVFAYFLALIFLGETISWSNIFFATMIMVGALGLTTDFSKIKLTFRKDIFGSMVLSSFLYAFNTMIFKVVAIDISFWQAVFWENTGIGMAGVIFLIFIKSYRLKFFDLFSKNKTIIISVNGINEIVNIVAKIIFNYVSLLIPLALAWAVNGIQPLFILAFGVILTLLFPRIFKEDISGKTFLKKLIFIILISVGVYFLGVS
ncbi:EamA family transporter, partial [Candidatus Falkowbacteria bacterium]|nr:EamA family transporter [Candidatus Falkowbacteria bacterium]